MNTKKISIKNKVNYHENLIKLNKLETRNIFIDMKNYKDMVICFTRCHPDKSIITLKLY